MPPSGGPSAEAVTVSISRDPALVRTVRLVAAATARRVGLADELVDEVRLAVGEACALLVARHDGDDAGIPVTVTISVAAGLDVQVVAQGSVAPADPLHGDGDVTGPWSLLRGLISTFHIATCGSQTTVSMSWPAP